MDAATEVPDRSDPHMASLAQQPQVGISALKHIHDSLC
jgi:hypothetical protein